ncbi:MAG TPA: hypothetical protein VGT02_09205 [Methylomirabilota bacterium]|nr:hypothetical protein [Methylomirabilota bacterium]
MIVAAAVVLAGCTTRFDVGGGDWTKPGAQIPQITLDEMACARDAVDARPFPDTLVGGLADIAMAKLQDVKMNRDFDRCMTGRGYRPTRAQG